MLLSKNFLEKENKWQENKSQHEKTYNVKICLFSMSDHD